ncbi:hypothetical protein C4577_06920 [Candidatus Parcubacteria bacterium]|nr:MAG: hypothetical protein C4577_06920 [Candidatus Parcubacteria bacterium]
MKERIVIAFIALTIGLSLTTIGFFLYQSTKTISEKETKTIAQDIPTPTPKDTSYLTISEPKNEDITNKRVIHVKGKTNSENVIIVSTNQEDVVAYPSSEGQFSLSITIDAGSNKLITRSISPQGFEKIDERVITFSTEEF